MSQARPDSAVRELRLSGLPAGAYRPEGGGLMLVTYCLAAEVRAKTRRDAIERAARLHAKRTDADGPYPTALVLCQRAGLALQDLARLVLALEALAGPDDPFDRLRSASLEALDAMFDRLAEDQEELRRVLRLPTSEDTTHLPEDLRAAVLAASDLTAERWGTQWRRAAGGWVVLRRISKAMRHGTPVIPRDLIVGNPGGGVLALGAPDRPDPWVLLPETPQDQETTEFVLRGLQVGVSNEMLGQVRQTTLGAIALTRAIANGHAFRTRHGYGWLLPEDIVRQLPATHRRAVRALWMPADD